MDLTIMLDEYPPKRATISNAYLTAWLRREELRAAGHRAAAVCLPASTPNVEKRMFAGVLRQWDFGKGEL